MEIVVGDVHRHPPAIGLRYGQVDEGLHELQISTASRDIAGIVDPITPGSTTNTIGLLVGLFVALLLGLRVVVGGVPAPVRGLFMAMTGMQSGSVNQLANLDITCKLPLVALGTGQTKTKSEGATIFGHVEGCGSVWVTRDRGMLFTLVPRGPRRKWWLTDDVVGRSDEGGLCGRTSQLGGLESCSGCGTSGLPLLVRVTSMFARARC